MKLYYSGISYTADSAGYAASYSHTNLALPSIVRSWREGAPADNWVQASSAAGQPVYMGVQALAGATAGTVYIGPNVGALTVLPGAALTVHADGAARAKGLSTISHAGASTPVIRLQLTRTSALSLGALYLFTQVLSVPDALLRSEMNTVYPQTEVALPNGVQFNVDRGVPRAHITLRWRRPRSEDIEQIARLARAGICWLDLEVPGAPWLQWPVRLVQGSVPRQFATALEDETSLEFVEIA